MIEKMRLFTKNIEKMRLCLIMHIRNGYMDVSILPLHFKIHNKSINDVFKMSQFLKGLDMREGYRECISNL